MRMCSTQILSNIRSIHIQRGYTRVTSVMGGVWPLMAVKKQRELQLFCEHAEGSETVYRTYPIFALLAARASYLEAHWFRYILCK
jgi:hypothetical protein